MLNFLRLLLYFWIQLSLRIWTHIGRLFPNRPSPRAGSRAKVKPSLERRAWKSKPKPPWVGRQIIRLAALMPEAGCRQIAATFNRLWEAKRGETVSKSYVAAKRKEHQLEILKLRQDQKNRIPRPMPRNITWGMDLTFFEGRPVLGILDHGSRANLALLPIKTKATIQILRALLDTIERFGLPNQIRTDNEACFTSKLMRLALSMLGIRHQRIDRCAPWQNGRIERFFGTLKSKAKQWQARNGSQPEDLDAQLQCFRFWFNQVRPHQHLGGRTPAEVWNGSERKRNDQSVYFSAWGDLLTGFFVPK